ncbi:YjfB family protein [Viridibacterium curvum]|uniref:Motility protein n=1 Tax=Viridibacterium curvum TaxID=1101404 RepID=A0ABP9R2T4_9RHOO
MDDLVGSVTRGLTTESVSSVRGEAQVAVLKKAVDAEAQQAAQLVEALPKLPPVSPGQPGGIINTRA